MAVLRVFDVPDEDGMRRYWDAHATNGALELEPGNYALVLRETSDGVSGTDNKTGGMQS
jgi:hypothetical protein